MITPFSQALLDWYAQYARVLPWRDHPDPYAIWVSEIMLQQTRVETVRAYYERWMARFPTLHALVVAPLQEVLAAWEGLGYYSRARNLQRAAQILQNEYDGRLPQSVAALRQLPGIGRYTAAALASIAFGQDEAALDGNIRRVLARVFDVELPARSTQGERRLWELATENLPRGQAGDYNQAMMDLGALICLPQAPRCQECPVAQLCKARAAGIQNDRPVLSKRPPTPLYTVSAAVIQRGEQILLAQRPLDGLLGGLWEFPGGKLEPGEDLSACLRREICEELGVEVQVDSDLGVYRHAYTHFRVRLHAFACRLLNGAEPRPLQGQAVRWVLPGELMDYPMGKLDRQIARRILAEQGLPVAKNQITPDNE